MQRFLLGPIGLFLIAVTVFFLVQGTLDASEAAASPNYWDPMLDTLGVTLQPAADCSQGCWRLIEAHYEDIVEGYQCAGDHNICGRLQDISGNIVAEQPWHVFWADGDVRLLSKAAPDWADFPMYNCYFPEWEVGGYSAHAGDDATRSDQVRGMGLPTCHHVNFRLTWQWTSSGSPSVSPSPIIPVPINVTPRAWLPVVWQSIDSFSTPLPVRSPTPEATRTPSPTPTGGEAGFSGEIVETFQNCGLTQVFGVVHDQHGDPLRGQTVRLTWDASNAQTFTTTSGHKATLPDGTYDTSGWEIFLDGRPVANVWRVAVIDSRGVVQGEEVLVRTSSTCNPNDVNVAKIKFKANEPLMQTNPEGDGLQQQSISTARYGR